MNYLSSTPISFNDFLKHTEAHTILAEGVTDSTTLIDILCDVLGYSDHTLTGLPTTSVRSLPSTTHSNLPSSVWLAPMEPETRHWLTQCILNTSTVIEHSGSAPSESAVVICSPLGQDVSSQVLLHRLPATRTVGIDGFLPLNHIKHLTLMANPATEIDALSGAVNLFATTGKKISVIRDSAGFIIQRILLNHIAMACHLAQQHVLTPQAIDQAILDLNIGYHQGLLAWGDLLNPSRVAHTLAALKKSTGSSAYTPSLWLQHRAQLNLSLLNAGI